MQFRLYEHFLVHIFHKCRSNNLKLKEQGKMYILIGFEGVQSR
jgi:hypothetical protein